MTQQAVIHAGVLHFLEEQAHTIGAGEYQPGVCSQVSVGFLHGRHFVWDITFISRIGGDNRSLLFKGMSKTVCKMPV